MRTSRLEDERMKKHKTRFDEEAFFRKMMEEERAFLNPDEWGMDLRPVFKEYLDPPADPGQLSDYEVTGFLRCMVDLLAQHHLCLVSTNHLTDRELYQLIMDEILPRPLGIGPDPVGGIVYHECRSCEEPELRPEQIVSDRDTWLDTIAEAYRDRPLPQAQ